MVNNRNGPGVSMLLCLSISCFLPLLSTLRGLKDMEQDISSIEKRFAYGFLQKLLKWMDIAQEFIAHLGNSTSILELRNVTSIMHLLTRK